MDLEFSTRQTAESKSARSSFRMDKSDIWDPARLSVRAHPVCVVHQLLTPGSRFSSCSIRGRYKDVAKNPIRRGRGEAAARNSSSSSPRYPLSD